MSQNALILTKESYAITAHDPNPFHYVLSLWISAAHSVIITIPPLLEGICLFMQKNLLFLWIKDSHDRFYLFGSQQIWSKLYISKEHKQKIKIFHVILAESKHSHRRILATQTSRILKTISDGFFILIKKKIVLIENKKKMEDRNYKFCFCFLEQFWLRFLWIDYYLAVI